MGSELYTNETKFAAVFPVVLKSTNRNNILETMA
jgi:hypothetical protein